MLFRSLIFGNHLKFDQDSYHTSKGRPTFLLRERERSRSSTQTTQLSRGASNGPRGSRSFTTVGGRTKAQWFSIYSQPRHRQNHNIWTLAFKNTEIGIDLRGFDFEKGFYYILEDHFQKSKNLFPKKSFVKREVLRYFHMGLYRFPHMLYCIPSHANIG